MRFTDKTVWPVLFNLNTLLHLHQQWLKALSALLVPMDNCNPKPSSAKNTHKYKHTKRNPLCCLTNNVLITKPLRYQRCRHTCMDDMAACTLLSPWPYVSLHRQTHCWTLAQWAETGLTASWQQVQNVNMLPWSTKVMTMTVGLTFGCLCLCVTASISEFWCMCCMV